MIPFHLNPEIHLYLSGFFQLISTVDAILERGEAFTNSLEFVTKTCKNLEINLMLAGFESIADFSVSLIDELRAFKKAYDAALTLPQIQLKAVLPANINVVLNFVRQMEIDPSWEKVIMQAVMRHNLRLQGKVYFSGSVLQGIWQAKTLADWHRIAWHLMSECTKASGGARTIDCKFLCILLDDEHVKDMEHLREAIKIEALAVMYSAIRKCQSDIVFQSVLKASDIKNAQTKSEQWLKCAEKYPESYLELEGIGVIAEMLRLNVEVNVDAEDKNYSNALDFFVTREAIKSLDLSNKYKRIKSVNATSV